MNTLQKIALASAVILTAAAYPVYQYLNKPTAEQQYRLMAVEKGDLKQTVSANGTINPVSLINIGTQVSGTVKKLYVDFNSKVEKGQVLLELDDALLAAQLKQSSANVLNATASLELATANEARTRGLFAQEYVSKLELDTAVQARKSAAAQLQLNMAVVEKDRANLAYSVIRSPVAGVVIDRTVDVGQTVAASLQTPTLFKIAQDLSKMQIDALFAEADIGNIRVGQKVRFSVDAFAGRNFMGEVRQIRMNPTSLQNVVTYDVVINVDNPEQILMPGMTAYVGIAVAQRKEVLMVPNAALRFKPANGGDKPNAAKPAEKVGEKPAGERSGRGDPSGKPKQDGFTGKVYVLEKGKLKLVNITLGITDNRNTEVVSGDLKVGDQIVLSEMQSNAVGQGKAPPRMF
ncbi:MAG: efflux RND transporter periplasmic adaptor subunit [Gallionella sp.]|nr:efflux RND transporter periplasmic adaptor subunit [Gallionella sp.]MDD4958045.1 efflux RND transporter periplasmic adaptor subunit [Gallionella sp.]